MAAARFMCSACLAQAGVHVSCLEGRAKQHPHSALPEAHSLFAPATSGLVAPEVGAYVWCCSQVGLLVAHAPLRTQGPA